MHICLFATCSVRVSNKIANDADADRIAQAKTETTNKRLKITDRPTSVLRPRVTAEILAEHMLANKLYGINEISNSLSPVNSSSITLVHFIGQAVKTSRVTIRFYIYFYASPLLL